MKPFLPALLLFLAIVVSAPAIGHVRDFVFDTFPENGVRVLAGGFALVAAGFLVYGVVRIRRRRWLRYGGLVAVAVLLWLQTIGLSTGYAQVDAAEKIHVLEYGALAFLLYRALLRRSSGAGDPSLLATALFGVVLAGVADETVQWLSAQRVGDVRDVALNASAGVSGLLFALCLKPPARWSWRLDEGRRRLLARGAALAVLVVGLFFYGAHLGYEIADPEIGRFRSQFTAEELAELTVKRGEAWKRNPPTGLETWALEDRYLTEAARHANHRNSSHRAGLYTMAWLANRVLEKHYEPFLELETFRGEGGPRYPPEVRRELEEKKGGWDPETYLSPVLVKSIRPWSKPWFLVGLGVLTVAIWTSPRWSAARGRRARLRGEAPELE